MLKKILSLTSFEYLFSVLALFHLSQGLIPLLIIRGASEGDGINLTNYDYSINAKISILIYLISFLLLVLRWKKVADILTKDKLIWPFILVISLSSFWSVAPSETFRYSIYAIGTTAFGIYLATRYTFQQLFNILCGTFILSVVLSVLFVVALPHYGIMAALHEGAVRGVYTHKNQFGLVMVPAAVIFLLRASNGKSLSWLFWLLLAVTVALVVLSRSTTSLGNLLIMLSLCALYRIFRWRYEYMITAILLGLIIGIAGILLFIYYGESDLLLVAVGKDSTFSGRTDIWLAVLEMINRRFWLGYGLAAFWRGLEGPSAFVELAVRTQVAYAHNGFLDLWLGLGLIGVFTFLVSFFNTAIKSLTLLRNTKTVEGLWPLLFLTYILLSNISEGTIVTMDNMFWAIYVALNFSLAIAQENNYSLEK
ncbi:O-antigen polymerase [Stanieria cyanosphaera PCC 7437]|uniref:O-antigen polymerase n=1 Tax=Stanieria cyanosphaera (strain ATCC 29371 / PCC 7437) TaxID=111780 RepID=K9XZV3_STAC7|nr:O-antigen ligase family protein [Stanieria cyanosphaera]AFZ37212.1 O-antigen polymerase [Stanieria cyanosphaera PCC 7437]